MYYFQQPTLEFKTVSEQYGTLLWKTSNIVDFSQGAIGRASTKRGSAECKTAEERVAAEQAKLLDLLREHGSKSRCGAASG